MRAQRHDLLRDRRPGVASVEGDGPEGRHGHVDDERLVPRAVVLGRVVRQRVAVLGEDVSVGGHLQRARVARDRLAQDVDPRDEDVPRLTVRDVHLDGDPRLRRPPGLRRGEHLVEDGVAQERRGDRDLRAEVLASEELARVQRRVRARAEAIVGGMNGDGHRRRRPRRVDRLRQRGGASDVEDVLTAGDGRPRAVAASLVVLVVEEIDELLPRGDDEDRALPRGDRRGCGAGRVVVEEAVRAGGHRVRLARQLRIRGPGDRRVGDGGVATAAVDDGAAGAPGESDARQEEAEGIVRERAGAEAAAIVRCGTGIGGDRGPGLSGHGGL